jgi:hypothetical protein
MTVCEAFAEQGILDTFRSVQDTRLIALDGILQNGRYCGMIYERSGRSLRLL